MPHRDDHPSGVPCWIDTAQPDPQAAAEFYGRLFGWEFRRPRADARRRPGVYVTARIGRRAVAGIGQAPAGTPVAVWTTYVRVASVEEAIQRVREAGGELLAGPLDSGEVGRLAVLADTTGVPVAVCDAGGVELVDEPGAWAMSALHSADPDGAQMFYGAVFGWQREAVPGTPLSFFRLPGYGGGDPGRPIPRDVVAVMTPTAGTEVPPHWAVNLQVADADATAAQAAALGGTVLLEPMDTPGLRSAVIADPQGGVVAISAPA